MGRCRRHFRAWLAMRAGTVISWARIVVARARPWAAEAMAPAARVRLKAIAAQASQAALTVNTPEGGCASGPFFRSAMTCATIAWSWWETSAARGEPVNTVWWRYAVNSSSCPAGALMGFRRLPRRTVNRALMCSAFLREVKAI